MWRKWGASGAEEAQVAVDHVAEFEAELWRGGVTSQTGCGTNFGRKGRGGGRVAEVVPQGFCHRLPHIRHSGKMYDRVDGVVLKQRVDRLGIAEVSVRKLEAVLVGQSLEDPHRPHVAAGQVILRHGYGYRRIDEGMWIG